MATFAQLKSKLVDWIGADSSRLSDSVQGDIINMAQREILRQHDLRFGETHGSITTVASQAAYALPTGFSRPLKLWFVASNPVDTTELNEISREKYVHLYPDYAAPVSTDAPTNYAIWGASIYLGPVPSEVQTLSFDYYALLTDLSADGDHNDFTDYAWELILWKALTLATQYLIEDPRASLWEANYQRALLQVLGEHARSRGAGRRPVSSIPG